MKLLTYNFLTSKCIRGVKVGFPLKLNIVQKEETTLDFDAEFISRMVPRLDWPAICIAAEQVGCGTDFPTDLVENYSRDLTLLQRLHHILLEIDIIEGDLECPETGRKFPIAEGIPNMLLNEDEV